ncbi:LacI family DNA-binding transcriptional regulator [Sunxiuqinia sp. A32]|uniref:LacI family DNA-binding transcriptional regulator n=1 Tax=Sunxiuqinia sp. A32 TaxID=3461496 RepID=UPI0040464A7A
MSKETLISISKKTGFSVSTVSRVLNGKAKKYRISKTTEQKILEEAKKSNYSPSLLARSLRTQKTFTIGLLIPSITNPFFANIASIVVKEAKLKGYTIILVDSEDDEQTEIDSAELLLARKIDGLIVIPCGQDPDFLENIQKSGTPVMLIDRYFEKSKLPYLCTDNFQGSFDATNLLLKNGHRNIACIQGVPHSTPNKERVNGFKKALEDSGITTSIHISGTDFNVENGYLETKLLLKKKEKPTAIFALSNTIALGAFKAIREANLQIPEQISLIAFDDYTYLDFLQPPITRIAQPIEEIGKLAVTLLTDEIDEKLESTENQVQIPPRLIIRESVARIN